MTPATQQAYRSLAESGELTARVVGALWWDRHRGLEQIDELLERSAESAQGFHPTTVKIMIGGVLENYTGALLEPYCDGCGGHTSNHGMTFVDADLLDAAVTSLDRHGLQVHMHAIGDRAVRMGLDAVQGSQDGQRPSRQPPPHRSSAGGPPDDIVRFARLGVVANCQMYWPRAIRRCRN